MGNLSFRPRPRSTAVLMVFGRKADRRPTGIVSACLEGLFFLYINLSSSALVDLRFLFGFVSLPFPLFFFLASQEWDRGLVIEDTPHC